MINTTIHCMIQTWVLSHWVTCHCDLHLPILCFCLACACVGDWCKGRSHRHVCQEAVDEERMRPGHWLGRCFVFTSVLWHCLLGDRKDIQPINILCHIPRGWFQPHSEILLHFFAKKLLKNWLVMLNFVFYLYDSVHDIWIFLCVCFVVGCIRKIYLKCAILLLISQNCRCLKTVLLQ